MPEYVTEARQFRGLDGYVGFRRGRIYQLRFRRLADGTVHIELDHAPGIAGPLLVPAARFEEWWTGGKEY